MELNSNITVIEVGLTYNTLKVNQITDEKVEYENRNRFESRLDQRINFFAMKKLKLVVLISRF